MLMYKIIVSFLLRSVFFGLTSVAIAKNDKALCLKKDRAVFSAEQTLRCFLSLDAEGARLYGGSEKLTPSQLTGWEAEPGWDILMVIDKYEFKSVPCSEMKDSKACFTVNYFEWIEISSNFELASIPKNTTLNSMNFELSQRANVWEISNPEPFFPRITVSTALKHFERKANSLSSADKVKTYNAHEKLWKIIHKLETLRQ